MLKNKINNIKIFAYHGVYEKEKNNGQNFIVNIEYIPNYIIDEDFISFVNIKEDDIEGVINYVDVVKELEECFNMYRFNLLESLGSFLIKHMTNVFEFKYLKIVIRKDFNKSIKINADSVELEWEYNLA